VAFPDDIRRRGIADAFESARVAHWIAALVVPKRLRDDVWGDLREDYTVRFPHGMPRGHASRWLLRQLVAAAPRFAVCRFRTEVSIRNWCAVLTSTLMGLALAYVESRPTWDDMGVLVAGIVIAAATMGWAASRFPWLVALAIGVWIPLHDVVAREGYASLVAIVFALVGAYAGSATRRLLTGPKLST
jgi:hypothetical protein